MKRDYFLSLENLTPYQSLDLDEFIHNLAFNEQGLIPVITQDIKTNTVLMFAWMNRQALNKTIDLGLMTYWSRSRKKLWVKGESSGHFQSLRSLRFDCDGDAVLCLVEQEQFACHTGRKSCFYFELEKSTNRVVVISASELS